MAFEIESGVAMPTKRYKGKGLTGGGAFEAGKTMEVGQSFLVGAFPTERQAGYAAQQCRSHARKGARPGAKFASRTWEADGRFLARVWRTK